MNTTQWTDWIVCNAAGTRMIRYQHPGNDIKKAHQHLVRRYGDIAYHWRLLRDNKNKQ